jgi:hypothetical protein
MVGIAGPSSEAIAYALRQLRRKGGFGLTVADYRVWEDQETRLAVETDSNSNQEVSLPGAPGSGWELKLPMPAGMETMAPKPELKADKIFEFIQQPPRIDLKEQFDPGTSTAEEFDQKLRDLQYRKDWLEALLAVTNDELAAFSEARNQCLTSMEVAPPQKMKED